MSHVFPFFKHSLLMKIHITILNNIIYVNKNAFYLSFNILLFFDKSLKAYFLSRISNCFDVFNDFMRIRLLIVVYSNIYSSKSQGFRKLRKVFSKRTIFMSEFPNFVNNHVFSKLE